MADFQDVTLTCRDCGSEFVWTAGEQQFFADKGFKNPPVRCANCRNAKKTAIAATRQMFTVTCSKCGGEAQVPFKPNGDRPVYCSKCYAEMKGQTAA